MSNTVDLEAFKRKVETGDEALAKQIRDSIESLRTLFNEAAERGITINFNIGKGPNARQFEITQLEITKKLL